MTKLIINIAIIVALLIGEIKCIVKFCKCDFKESYKAEIIYGVTMCCGLGSVTGWMDFGK